MMRNSARLALEILAGVAWAAADLADGRCETVALPSSLAVAVLSESDPFAFAPNDFQAADFSLEWIGAPLPGISAKLGEKSLEWIRVAEVLLLPRARLVLQAEDIEAGSVFHAGFTQPISLERGKGKAEMPVALISGEQNPIIVTLRRPGGKDSGQREEVGKLKVVFHPRPITTARRVFVDASCSKFNLDVGPGFEEGPRVNEWVYLGCRVAQVKGSEHNTSSLEVYVFWDNVGQVIQGGGIDVPSSSTSLWAFRLSAVPGRIHLKSLGTAGSSGRNLILSYEVPEYFHRAFVGAGVGPYSYIFQRSDEITATFAPEFTLYGSYVFTNNVRIVAFDATAFNENNYTDFGIYFSGENFRAFDRRLSVNLMLGAHVIGFRSLGQYYFRLGAPQGVELIFHDAFYRRYDMTLGGFIFPRVNGKSYTNIWLRFGNNAIFGEINFISWNEFVSEIQYYSRSVGISVGFPLFRFF